jgi:hypothetical protein
VDEIERQQKCCSDGAPEAALVLAELGAVDDLHDVGVEAIAVDIASIFHAVGELD